MNRLRGAASLLVAAAVLGLSLSGCGSIRDAGAAGSGDSLFPAAGEVVFPAGEPVWAEWSTIHAGDAEIDVSPLIVTDIDATPYGLFIGTKENPDGGPLDSFFHDGTRMISLTSPDNVVLKNRIVTSADGRYAAWINSRWPDVSAGDVAEVVVVDVPKGEVVFRSTEGMGEGDSDLVDAYEEVTPQVEGFEGDRLYWSNADGAGDLQVTTLPDGATRGTLVGPDFFDNSSPDGTYTVDAQRKWPRLQVDTRPPTPQPEQPEVGHRFQVFGGWLDDHTLLVLAADKRPTSHDFRIPDPQTGYLMSCDLEQGGPCQELAPVAHVSDARFAGIDPDSV